jgi:tetratricopeptide (TPR) repeat protein/tRNA A-37 threonylcarbamoyl transferase component Bud32
MADLLEQLKAALADRYTIEREIGRGGMATVYLAEDLKHHRKVAVKVLRPELAAALGADRFHQEIEIAAQLTHPNILTLIDSGDADGLLYYVMPYVEGQSLRDKLAHEGELPIGEAVRILKDVVDALSEAHEHGVVHRDIKPDNILLTKHHALVTDFGVAKAVSEATGAHKLTTEGVALGTPAYMSPEQAAADKHIDHRADIYAVGALAYELLTGRPPFTGTTPQEVLAAHVTQTAEPVTKHRETVPPALAQLVMKCLEKKAADRWQSAEELLPQLEALATPSGGVTPTGTMPVDRVAKRRWMMVGGVVGVVAVIAVFVVTAALPRGSGVALDPNHVVVAVFRNSTGDPLLDHVGERAGHWITQGLQQASIPTTPWDLALQSSEYVQTEADAGRVRDPARALAEETGAGTVVSGAVYLVEGDSLEIQVNVTDATRGRPLGVVTPVRGLRSSVSEIITDAQQRVMAFLAIRYEELFDWAPGAIGEPPTFEAYQAFTEGRREQNRGRDEAAILHYQRAFDLDSSWAQPLLRMSSALWGSRRFAEHDSVVRILEGLGDRLSPFDRAEVQFQRAMRDREWDQMLTALRRAAELAPQSPASFNIAWALAGYFNRPREAVDILLTADPERHGMRDMVSYWTVLFGSLGRLDRYDEAVETARRAHRLHPEHGDLWLRCQADALAAMGRVAELNEVLDQIETTSENPRRSLVEPVEVLHAYGHDGAVEEVVERVIDSFEARPADQASDPSHRHWYGRALFLAGRRDEAQEVYDALVDETPDNPWRRATRAFIAASRGDTTQALRDQEWFEDLEPGKGQVGTSLYLRGLVAGALGDHERAMELIRRSYDEPEWRYGWLEGLWMMVEPMRDYPPFQEFLRPKG